MFLVTVFGVFGVLVFKAQNAYLHILHVQSF